MVEGATYSEVEVVEGATYSEVEEGAGADEEVFSATGDETAEEEDPRAFLAAAVSVSLAKRH